LVEFLEFLVQTSWPTKHKIGNLPNYNKNLSGILPSSGWAQVTSTKPKWPKTYPTYITHKNRNPKPFSSQMRRLAWSYDGLDSSVTQLTDKLWSCKVAWN